MKKIFMFVNVDWFFLSHRLPIARAARGYEVDMSVYTDFTKHQQKNNRDGYNLYQSPIRRTSKTIFHVIFEFFNAYILVKDSKPDLIHAVTIKPILLLGLIARHTSAPFIAAISGLGPAFQSKSSFSRIRLIIVVWLLRAIFKNRKARIICQSMDDRDVLVRKNITRSENVTLVSGSGVDVDLYSPKKKKTNCEKYILMSSRILGDKGVKEYCLAAKIVNSMIGSEVKFKLSGPVDSHSPTFISEPEIKKLAASCGVEYLGNRDDMPELLASAFIFVLPSYYAEGLPKVLLEASSCGVPIITTDHTGCRNAVIEGETGLLVPVRDAEALANAIMKLINDTDLVNQMGKNGRILAESDYRDSKVVEDHYLLYRQMCG